MGRRQQRAQRKRDEAAGVDTRTGEVPNGYGCPPELCAPCVVEDWLTSADIGISRDEAALRAWGRWRRARYAYADERGGRREVFNLCGPDGRWRWRDES